MDDYFTHFSCLLDAGTYDSLTSDEAITANEYTFIDTGHRFG